MKKLIFFIFSIPILSFKSNSQSKDTLAAKVIWIKDFQECRLIGVIPVSNIKDTVVLISETRHEMILKGKKRKKIQLNEEYNFIVLKDVPFGSPPKKWSVFCGDSTTIWTNQESYKLKPKLCLNCAGLYIYKQY
jgi:hypothetical protein